MYVSKYVCINVYMYVYHAIAIACAVPREKPSTRKSLTPSAFKMGKRSSRGKLPIHRSGFMSLYPELGMLGAIPVLFG